MNKKLTKYNVKEIIINEIKDGLPTLNKIANTQEFTFTKDIMKNFKQFLNSEVEE